jgi:hypothetical protein
MPLLFLAVVDAKDGTSRRVATGMLKCSRGLGARGRLLPKSMEKRWGFLKEARLESALHRTRTHSTSAARSACESTFYNGLPVRASHSQRVVDSRREFLLGRDVST